MLISKFATNYTIYFFIYLIISSETIWDLQTTYIDTLKFQISEAFFLNIFYLIFTKYKYKTLKIVHHETIFLVAHKQGSRKQLRGFRPSLVALYIMIYGHFTPILDNFLITTIYYIVYIINIYVCQVLMYFINTYFPLIHPKLK